MELPYVFFLPEGEKKPVLVETNLPSPTIARQLAGSMLYHLAGGTVIQLEKVSHLGIGKLPRYPLPHRTKSLASRDGSVSPTARTVSFTCNSVKIFMESSSKKRHGDQIVLFLRKKKTWRRFRSIYHRSLIDQKS